MVAFSNAEDTGFSAVKNLPFPPSLAECHTGKCAPCSYARSLADLRSEYSLSRPERKRLRLSYFQKYEAWNRLAKEPAHNVLEFALC